MPAASTERTPSTKTSSPECRTSGSSIPSVPFDRIQRGRGARRASVVATSGKGASVEVGVLQGGRVRSRRGRCQAPPARSPAPARSRRRSRPAATPEFVMRLPSHVYSSCFVRQSCDSVGAAAGRERLPPAQSPSGRRTACRRRRTRAHRHRASCRDPSSRPVTFRFVSGACVARARGQKNRGYTCA